MFDTLTNFLDTTQEFLWGYAGVFLIVVVGLYLALISRLFPIRRFPTIAKTFGAFLKHESEDKRGSHPLQVFFAAVGGCIGIGNVVSVCVAVQIGGPGAVFWIWITSILGMMLKYGEVFLGIKYRVPNEKGGYDGGPMFFLPKAFKVKWVAIPLCLFLCIYGVEVFMFKVVVQSVALNFSISKTLIMILLLIAVFYASLGGVKRVAKISSVLVPIFVLAYIIICAFVLFQNASAIPAAFASIFSSAFTGHAAVGGFVGSTMIMAIAQGVAAGSYTGDIGIGYASVIHSETSETNAVKQASLAIMGIFLDTIIICTLTLLVILTTGLWKESIDPAVLVQTAFAQYLPEGMMKYFMTLLIFLLAFSTITAYLCVGLKCAQHLFKKKPIGTWLFLLYALIAFVGTSFFEPRQLLTIMMLAGGGLMLLNISGIFVMGVRKKLSFSFPED